MMRTSHPIKALVKQALLISILISTAGCLFASEIKSINDIPRNATLSSKKINGFPIRLALTDKETTQGLSGLQPDQFSDKEGMLFIYTFPSHKRFWMPDTYFDLDIFFLDENLVIVDVDRNVKHHPGRSVPPTIAMTRSIYSQHILEIKSGSKLAKQIQIGDQLTFDGKISLKQIIELLKKGK